VVQYGERVNKILSGNQGGAKKIIHKKIRKEL
jgi:hypothetical protein